MMLSACQPLLLALPWAGPSAGATVTTTVAAAAAAAAAAAQPAAAPAEVRLFIAAASSRSQSGTSP